MKKVVISGSSKLQNKVNYWLEHFKNKDYVILDYPKLIHQDNYIVELPTVIEISILLWKIQMFSS